MPRLSEPVLNISRCKYKNLYSRKANPIFRQLLPAELKDSIRGRKGRSPGGCGNELQAVLTCFNKHDFDSKPCHTEIQTFQRCFAEHEMKTRNQRELESKGVIADDETNLSRRQVNTLLQRNPQIRPTKQWKVPETLRHD